VLPIPTKIFPPFGQKVLPLEQKKKFGPLEENPQKDHIRAFGNEHL
jgi:hypothetical protein